MFWGVIGVYQKPLTLILDFRWLNSHKNIFSRCVHIRIIYNRSLKTCKMTSLTFRNNICSFNSIEYYCRDHFVNNGIFTSILPKIIMFFNTKKKSVFCPNMPLHFVFILFCLIAIPWQNHTNWSKHESKIIAFEMLLTNSHYNASLITTIKVFILLL